MSAHHTPTANDLMLLADQLATQTVEYVCSGGEPDPDKLAAATLTRRTLHAAIALVFAELTKATGAAA